MALQVAGLQTASRHFKKDLRQNLKDFLAENTNTSDTLQIVKNISGVACLVMIKNLEETKNLSGIVTGYKFSKEVKDLSQVISGYEDPENLGFAFNAPLKDSELFTDGKVLSFGSGFLVSQDELMTAGHNVCDDAANSTDKLMPKFHLDNIRVVFGFTDDVSTFAVDQVYKISQAMKYHFKTDESGNPVPDYPDMARLKLEKAVASRYSPLKVGFKVEKGDWVYNLGHPSGLSLKVCSLAFAKIQKVHEEYITDNTDMQAGSSGCPVINRETNEVVSITVRGLPDYIIDKDHWAQTGERRVITYITPTHLQKNGQFNHAQRLHLSFFDLNSFVSVNGHAMRPYLSNIRDKKYVEQLDSFLETAKGLRTTGIVSMLSIIALPIGIAAVVIGDRGTKTYQKERRHLEKIKNQHGLNIIESEYFLSLQKVNIPNQKKFEIVRNMAAYNLNEKDATELENHVKP